LNDSKVSLLSGFSFTISLIPFSIICLIKLAVKLCPLFTNSLAFSAIFSSSSALKYVVFLPDPEKALPVLMNLERVECAILNFIAAALKLAPSVFTYMRAFFDAIFFSIIAFFLIALGVFGFSRSSPSSSFISVLNCSASNSIISSDSSSTVSILSWADSLCTLKALAGFEFGS